MKTAYFFWLLALAVCYPTEGSTLADRLNCGPNDAAPATRVNTTERLRQFRADLATITSNGDPVLAFVVGSGDAHDSEYPSDYDKRRGYISGFSGSAGTAVITATKAALWTDGRYFLEAEEALDCNWILMKYGLDDTPSIEEWLNDEISTSQALVGVDKSLITNSYFQRMSEKLQSLSQRLVLKEIISSENPVDQIWTTDRPAQPTKPINPLLLKFAGKSWLDKIEDLRANMTSKNAVAFVVTSLDETAWLFNLRGSDVAYNPFFLSYAIVESNRVRLYLLNKNSRLTAIPTDPASENVTLASHLQTSNTGTCSGSGDCVQVEEYDQATVETALQTLSGSGLVWITHLSNYGIYMAVQNNRLVENSPIALDKSIKNSVERDGMQTSYNRDSAVLIKFMAFLEQEIKAGKRWTEVTAGTELDNRRRNAENSRGLSFETISSYGSNGAVIHYRPSNVTDKVISTDSLYLLDSGGQYLEGTTDVTRTMHYGEPSAYQKECYTRVLASVINLARLIWPEGLYGHQIDTLARFQLWEAGLIYQHGTGHGIGAYLSVHEGPGGISQRTKPSQYNEAINAYQFYSDEPGYYEDNKFGIRLETIMMVTPHIPTYSTAGVQFFNFTPITLVPFETNMIDFTFLSVKQIDWLNDYNALIRKEMLPLLTSDSVATDWVNSRTEPIDHGSGAGKTSLIQSSVTLILSSIILTIWKI